VAIDEAAFVRSFPGEVPALLTGWAHAAAARSDDSVPLLRKRIEQATPTERWEILTSFLREEVSAVLELDPASAPGLRQGFFSLGMDSLMALGLKNRLQARLGHRLPATFTFNYPTIEALAGYLMTEIAGADAREAAPSEPSPRGGEEADRATDLLERLSEDELASLLDTELGSILEGERSAG
jgi:acyl carrier protein